MSEQLLASLAAQLKKLGSTGEKAGNPTPKLVPGERREIAIIFLDLKGFTALSEKLNDPEAINAIINGPSGIMTVLHQIVERHGGYVDKYEGDLIMALFGAKVASENDAYRAVSCGMKLIEAVLTVDEAVSELGIRIGARCGINFGWATFGPDPSGHHTAMGTAVNVASRMESSAAVNSVQVTSRVVKMTHDSFIWEDLGGIEVKGVAKPVHSYRLIGYGDIHKARWERTSWMQSVPLIGRQDEFDFLYQHWLSLEEEVEENPRGGAIHKMIGLRADPGCGKSRLVFELVKRVQQENEITFLRGHTMSVAQPPFYLWANLLRNFFRIVDDKHEHTRFEQLYTEFGSAYGLTDNADFNSCYPYLCHILGFHVEELSELADRVLFQQTKMAIRNFMQVLAQQLPKLVIFLDDLHWLDSGSQEILEFVLLNCDATRPMFILTTFRPDRDDGQQLELDLHDSYVEYHERMLTPLTLELTHQHVKAMLAAYSPNTEACDLDPVVVERIFDFSQGNPFYTEEFVLDWLETDALQLNENCWSLAPNHHGDLPNSITSLVRSRVDRLPLEEKQVLQQCSVMGLDFSLRLFQRVKAKLAQSDNAEPLLNGLVFRDFLRNVRSLKETSYKFKLTISRTVAYQTLLRENRTLLHRLTAEALEELLATDTDYYAGVLAEHWFHAGDLNKAFDYGIRSVKYLRRAWHNREAVKLGEAILNWFPPHDDYRQNPHAQTYFDLIYQLETIYAILGKRTEQKRLLDQLQEFVLIPPFDDHAAAIVNRMGNYHYLTGDISDAAECYELCREVAQARGDTKIAAQAIGNLGLISIQFRRIDEAEALLKQSIEMLHSIDDQHAVNDFELNLAGLFYEKKEPAESERLLEQCRERSKRLHDRSAEARLSINLSTLNLELEQFDSAIENATIAYRIFNEIGERKSEGVALANLGRVYLRKENREKARECLELALTIHREVNDSSAEKRTLKNLTELSGNT